MRRTEALRKIATALLANPHGRHYGYPLSKTAGIRSGVLYPALTRLEAAGWLTSDWDTPAPDRPGRPRRRYYQVTDLGRAEMTALLGR